MRENAVLIAVDVANTFGKGVALEIIGEKLVPREFSIPHGYMPLSPTQWQEAQSTSKSGRGNNAQTHTFKYVTGGDAKNPNFEAVKIGKSAVLSGTNATVYGNAKYRLGYMDAYLTAVLCEAFPKAKYPKGHDNLYLAIGFPSSDWQMVDATLIPLVNKAHRIADPDGGTRSFTPRHVMAVDENGGGMMNTLLRMRHEKVRESQSGKFTSLQSGEQILMLDAGGWLGSMAWGEVSENGFPQIDYTTGRILPIDGGIVTVRSALKEALKTRYSREIQGLTDSLMNDAWMDKIMLDKGFFLSGRKDTWFDASELIAEASGVYLNNVKSAYQRMGNGLQAAHIILTGGTINPLYEQIMTLLNHGSVILAENRHELYKANVRGILQILIDRLLSDGKMPSDYLPYFEVKA